MSGGPPVGVQRGRGRVLAGLMMTIALAAMDATIVATAVPSVVRDLGGFSNFPWVFSAYLLTQSVSIPLYGKLADLHGRKPVLMAGTLLFLAGSALSGLAWDMGALIAFRALQGIGAGAVQPVTATIAGDLYTVAERGRVQGWLASVWGVSAILGPAVGGLLTEYASWRWIFYINLPVGAVALVMIATSLREDVTRTRRRLDFAGAGLLVTSAGLLVVGLLQGGVAWPWASSPSLLVFGGSLAALAVFIWQERRAAEPVLPLWVFGRRLLVGVNLGSAVIGLLQIGMATFLPTYAQGVLGAGPIPAGFTLATMSIGWSLASPLSARIYRRAGFRDAALCGTALCLTASLVLALLPASAGIGAVAGGSLVMGLGLGLLATSLVVGVQTTVGWQGRGVVTGASMFSRMLGGAVGAAVYGGLANATLAGWLDRAPAALGGQLPSSVDQASSLLGDAEELGQAAAAYLRAGLDLATHRVFWGMVVAAAVGVVVLLATPRHFTRQAAEEP